MMTLRGAKTRLFETADEVAAAAADLILAQADAAIAARGAFRLVLAGGSTPTAAYRLLATRDARWDAWHIYFGDERCLRLDDAERNSVMAAGALLARVAIPPAQVHPIPAEQGAAAAAAAYETRVRDALPFDLVLLGMGEDGHTASLFPGHAIASDPLVVPVHDAPKPPSDRVSLTPKALCHSAQILLLITGAGKHDALERWRAGEPLPVARVAAAGNTLAMLDRAAAGR
jgi:6-phosphogluconolactonase